MSVRKRQLKNGYTWEYSITIQKNPRKQIKKSGFKTKYEAQEAEQKAERLYKNKYISLNPDKTTFKDIINLFLEHRETSNEYSEGTIQNYKGYYNNHLQYFLNFKITELNPLLIQNWFDASTKTKSPYIINGCRKLCKAAFNYAINKELIIVNPFSKMQKASEPIVIRKRFTLERLKEIINTCFEKMPDFFCIFCLATLTGARLGEYSAICVETIDFERQKIEIIQQYTRRKLKDRTKTKKSKRIIDFSYTMGKILKWHIRRKHIFSGFLFVGKDGSRPVSANWVNDRFDDLLQLCGYPKDYMRLHDLRGQYVDLMHSMGLPDVYISRSVGHARTSTTNDIYTEILSDVNFKASNKIEENIFCEHFVNI